jgi:glycerol-3-phosphate dehydrogenase
MSAAQVIVIGAGSTGAALAHDLALRGLQVTVIEQGGVASGVTGHNQAQLHSGARYAVNDPESARECIQENGILRKIMPEALELNEGLFVAVDEAGLDYQSAFLQACGECGIPVRNVPTNQALACEPRLNPNILSAVQIPDGVFDPYRFCLSFLASACINGARVLTFTRVTGLDARRGQVDILHRTSGKKDKLQADAIINAAGPWAGDVAAMAGVQVDVEASAGAMITVGERLCQQVLNLMAPPGDGDIIVPQRQTSILGTTSWKVDDPDHIVIPDDHMELIYRVAEKLVPAVRKAPVRGVMAASRPLLVLDGPGGRAATRAFRVFHHADQGAPGFFSIIGGKTSTSRLMAEKGADSICAYLGVSAACRTRVTVLQSHRLWAHL